MQQSEFNEMLKKLHEELISTESLDNTSIELLENIQGDLETILDEEQETGQEEHQSLSDKLRDAVDEYEESHPNLVIAMKHVLDSLANMGL
jgi:predicted component of type VI protein secretion system